MMDQETKEVVLTYETLYEILRKEKSRQGLQKIDSAFVHNVLTYLKDKQQSYDDAIAKNDIFSQGEREKLSVQIRNAKKLIRDLYDLRERKIINMAINHSRTKAHIIDAENLLSYEMQLFDSIHVLLNHNRATVLSKIIEMREPDLLSTTSSTLIRTERRTELNVDFKTEPVKNKPETKTGQKQIKFLEDIEQFVGEELELYGPYKAQDSAQLPTEVADVLVKQGRAAEL